MPSLTREKLDQARKLVADAGVDVWMVFVRETSGGSDPCLPLILDAGLTWQSALMVTRTGETIAVLGNYDADPLRVSGDWDRIVPYVQGIREPLLEVLDGVCGDHPRIAVNTSTSDDKADGITHGMYRLLETYLSGTRLEEALVSAEGIAMALRGRKSAEEVRRMRRAIAETDALFDLAAAHARVGASERAIYRLIQERIDAQGFGYGWERAGNPIVNSGPDSMIGHGIPSDTITIQPGHIFHIDLGVVVEGYSSDIQRCWFVGDSVPDDVSGAFDAVQAAISAGASMLRPGIAGWEVDAEGRRTLVDRGYPPRRPRVSGIYACSWASSWTNGSRRRRVARPSVGALWSHAAHPGLGRRSLHPGTRYHGSGTGVPWLRGNGAGYARRMHIS